MTFASSSWNVNGIITKLPVETYFQPIISIRRRAIVGIEALSRGTDNDKNLVSPLVLFQTAAQQNQTLELDRLCRITALNTFLPIHQHNPNLILFVNMHSAAVSNDANQIFQLANALQIDPRNIAIEVLESKIHDAAKLRYAVQEFRHHGFLMAIDDMGVGYSNLDRIANVKPDILKADVSLVRNIHKEYHKQEIFKSVVQLSEKIGGWVIAEGIETLDEAVCVLQLGGDLVQGFYFAHPHKVEDNEISCNWESVDSVALQFKNHTVKQIKNDYDRREERSATVKNIIEQLAKVEPERFEDVLSEKLKIYQNIESACVINEDGIQITDTVTNFTQVAENKTIIFKPPVKSSDHSLKEYFYALKEMRINIFETPPYVPLPTTDLCITASTFFKDVNETRFILCLHIKFKKAAFA